MNFKDLEIQKSEPFKGEEKIKPSFLDFFAGNLKPENVFMGDPFSDRESAGSIIFDNNVKKEDFFGFLRMIGIDNEHNDYSIFIKKSFNAKFDNYLTQMRIVSQSAIDGYFKTNDSQSFKQSVNMQEAFWLFMKEEQRRWGSNFCEFGEEGDLSEIFGYKDLDASPQLSFKFIIEDSYFGIYRIFSNVWILGK